MSFQAATRAKEIAEKKMQDEDFSGALEFALKAQKLFPGLDSISQMLTICKVHVSAESNVVGLEKNWYGILQISKTADESSIKEKYEKLTFLLHPNKNRFAGAKAAFNLIKQAHCVLSDQAQRSLYDSKLQTTIQTAKLMRPLPQPNSMYSQKQPSIGSSFTNHSIPQHQGMSQPHEQTQICPTFWTRCPFCTNTIYQKTLSNKPIRCQKCLKAFVTYQLIDRGLPKANSSYVFKSTHPEHKNIQGQGAHQVGPQSAIGNASSTMQCREHVSRGATSLEPFSKIRTNAEVAGVNQSKTSMGNEFYKEENVEMINGRAQTLKSWHNISQKRCRNMVVECSDSCDRESTTIEAVATKEDDVAKQSFKATSGRYLQRSTRQKKSVNYNENSSQPAAEKWKPSHGGPGSLDVLPSGKPGEASSANRQAEATWRTHPNDTSKHKNKNSPFTDSCLQCPRPLLHSFESEKSEDKFEEGQIWAMYGSDSGSLPMYYALIKKVESPKFRVHTARLEPFPSGNDILWAKKELPFGCGSFKLRACETKLFETSRMFSHQVSAVSWTDDRYSFVPLKGEVWAIYKNWSTEWTLTDMMHCEYELVEVIEHDIAGYRVLVLEVVDGFRTIYKGAGVEVDVMWNEVLQFSHRVPSFHLTEERGGNLRGYFVLDPAAIPDSKQDKVEEQNVDEQRASEGKQETSMQFNRISERPTSPSRRQNFVVSLAAGFTKSSAASSMVLSSEEAKYSQTFAEWTQHGFLEVGCPVEPAELEGVGDEYGIMWVQQCPKLFALFNPRPHYGTIIGVSESYLGLIRSSLWGTFANVVKQVAHFDLVVPNLPVSPIR